jgi:hypothetical protein
MLHAAEYMPVGNARDCFDALARRGHEPGLADIVGTWAFEIEDVGTWIVAVDHGALRVTAGTRTDDHPQAPATRLRLREDELLRLPAAIVTRTSSPV